MSNVTVEINVSNKGGDVIAIASREIPGESLAVVLGEVVNALNSATA